jgi:RNA methyltransferase, TrmH family
VLDNPKSDRVKGIARLQQKDARSETGLFLLEGPQGLKELVRVPELAQEILVTEEAAEKFHAELLEFERHGTEVTLCSERVMDKVAGTDQPQGVVAVVEQIDAALSESLTGSTKLIAVLDQVRDPGNAGTILRAADAAGADLVVFLKDSVDLYNPKLVRATAGSIFNVPVAQGVDKEELQELMARHSIPIWATSAAGESIADLGAELRNPVAWVFGNEAHGVSDELIQMADKVVSLPIFGKAESLNLATAASVCLYASALEMHRKH